tara:strand:+ start:13030 stop:14004 length:975 start_codon:yes stop_codon:yes gene_type:complete
MKKNNSEYLCHCHEVSKEYVMDYLKNNSHVSFEEFQRATKAGTKCSACLLQVEDLYIRESSNKIVNSKRVVLPNEQTKNLKQKFYNIIDSLSPNISWRLKNVFPILINKKIENIVWFANFSKLYSKDEKISSYKIYFELYNSDGKKIWSKIKNLDENELFQLKIPTEKIFHNGKDQRNIGIAWLNVLKIAKKFGNRGTSRPQIQLKTSLSSSAVHGQSASYRDGGDFTGVNNSKGDRQFITFINPGNKNINLDLYSNLNPTKNNEKPVIVKKILLSSKGCFIYEIPLAGDFGKPFRVFWQGSGFYKAHVLISNNDITRISLDHL